MAELFSILPNIIVYLASGFLFLLGFYLLCDKRFDFLSDISFTIMLVIGFIITTGIKEAPFSTQKLSADAKTLIIIVISFCIGGVISFLKNYFGSRVAEILIGIGLRKRTSTNAFWYEVLDKNDTEMGIRLVSYEKQIILQGILLSLDETTDNPYLLIGRCSKYDIKGRLIDNSEENLGNVQCVVKADDFDLIYLLYDEDSIKTIQI